MIVYVLILVIATTTSNFISKTTNVDVQTAVFESADRCLRNLDVNKAKFAKPGVTVDGTCRPQKLLTKGVK